MSAAGRSQSVGYVPSALEFYETPPEATRAILPFLGEPRTILDAGWLESQERSLWMRERKPFLHVLDRRPSFCVVVKCSTQKKGSKVPFCGFAPIAISHADARPARCPKCGAKVDFTTTDATGYGWFVFGRGWGLNVLEVQP